MALRHYKPQKVCHDVEVYKNENDNDNKKFFKINDERIPFEEFKVEQLERLISHRGMFGRSDILILWQVDIDKNGYEPTEEDNIRIVAVIATTYTAGPSQQGIPQNGVDWKNVNLVYNWMRELKRPSEIKKLVLVSAKFPLQGRDETLKVLLHGNETHNGICTGKSQFLQELPALLLNHNVDELKNLKILSVNVTFNGGFIALEDEIYAGPASVALRILYKHFLSSKAIDYSSPLL
ncbi:hypothetical protein RhiirA1_468051 [Rhizophagus irregularis]|uniref:Uncharacterized protein n=1 Tax=Rhizophagus irregularis TaxID=588596 RepID=A0A2N0RAS6_9GLOM|nr:hypothetical protein RhiirA1_468051 [Rhizophagus irregularis]